MKTLRRLARRWWMKRFNATVHFGLDAAGEAARRHDLQRFWFAVAVAGFGWMRSRSSRRLIYKTSIDVDEGATIRVLRGSRPIGHTARIP